MSQLFNRGEVKEGSEHSEEAQERTTSQKGYQPQGSSVLLDVNAGNSVVKCDMLSSMHEGAKRKLTKLFQDNDNRMHDEELGLNIYIKNIWIYINLMCTFTIHDLILISRSFKNTEIIYDDVVFSGKEDGSIFKDRQGKRKNSLFIYFQNYKIRKNVVKIFLQNPYAVCFIHKNGSVHVHGALTLRRALLILIKVIKRLKYKTFWTYLSGCGMGVNHQGVEPQDEGATAAAGVAPCDGQIVHPKEGRSNFPTFHQNEGGPISGESTPEQSIVEKSTPQQSITEGASSPEGGPPKKDKAKVFQTIRFCETIIEELRGKINKYGQDDWGQARALPVERLCQGGEKKEGPSESSKYYRSRGCRRWISKKLHAEVPSQLGHEQMDVHLNKSKPPIQVEEKRGVSRVDSPKGASSEECRSGRNDKTANVSESQPPHLCDHAGDSSELTRPNRSTTHFKPSNSQADRKNQFLGRKENDRTVERENYSEMGPFLNQFDQSAVYSKKCIYQFDTYRRWKYITRNDITFDMDHLNIKQLVSVFSVKLRHFDISKIYQYKEFKNIITDINNIIYIRIDHSLLCKLIQQGTLDPLVQNNFAEGCRPNAHSSVRTVLLFSSGNVVLYACKSRLEVLCVSRFIVNTLRRNNNIAM
ncbi:hypothetical protein C922_04578 [Plasmodium inui San Antonio 1]|uniref:Uncharacterized protein n=1 Tax=Plasmodium inui San Antonio 1 TaxID=1237626 RepID=W7A0H8_9APIC|nr:hypothetical protein C922_04578 [Plasmodium inui San Antonio 1]EUD65065.1 hypothetical protein C922_04578 [Plasmodium inui San Antonio 1]